MEGDLEWKPVWKSLTLTVWIVASLLGSVPWVLLTTLWLEEYGGLGGYSVGFIGAPLVWTGLALAAFLSRRPWATGAWAVAGAALWLVT